MIYKDIQARWIVYILFKSQPFIFTDKSSWPVHGQNKKSILPDVTVADTFLCVSINVFHGVESVVVCVVGRWHLWWCPSSTKSVVQGRLKPTLMIKRYFIKRNNKKNLVAWDWVARKNKLNS